MIDRINQYAASRFGGVGTSPGSFIRIHAWALIFLVAASALLPSRLAHRAHGRALAPVQNLALGQSDQRAFAPSPFPKKDFHIAWIMGSEGQVLPTVSTFQYIPSLVLPSLPEIDHRKPVVDVYYLPAMRTADILFSLLDAIASKPDMIVVSLNAAWAMNPIATHQWTQLDSRAALELSKQPKLWSVGASLLSPSDLMWGLASKLEPFKDRTYYSGKIHKLVDDLGPLNRSDLAKATATQKLDPAQRLVATDPRDFWFAHRLHIPVDQLGSKAGDTKSRAQWVKLLGTSNDGGNSLDRLLMNAIGTELRDSKIPSYVYLAQINQGWLSTDPAIARQVAGIERQLEDLRGAFTAPNILYQPKTLSRFVDGLLFWPGDGVHILKAGDMGPYLGIQLCRLVAQVGASSNCNASPEGSAGG